MNYRHLYLFVLLIFISNSLFAQKLHSVEGAVQSESGTPVDGAVISIMTTRDTATSKVLITEADGSFTTEELQPGSYFLLVTDMGYERYFSNSFSIDSTTKNIKIPTILLKRDDKQLEAVTVEAKKNLVERKMDRTIVNVNSFIGNAGNNMLEVLGKSPGVSVDADGKIQLRGKSGVVVYIDDRPTYLSAEDLANYLRSLPASSVDVLEIMTNPPAKYDAAGNAGVINIKLKRTKAQGFNGSFSTSYGQGFYARTSNSFNFNYRVNKINLFSNVSYSIYNTYQDLNLERKYYDADGSVNSSFKQNSYIKRGSKGANVKVGMDYYLNKKSTFGIVFSGFRNADDKPINNKSVISDGNGEMINNVTAYVVEKKVLTNKGLNLNYNYKIDSLGKEISANVDYLDYDGPLENALLNSVYRPDGTLDNRSNLIGDLPSNIKIATAKVDYTHPVKGIGTFSIGAKTSLIKTKNVANFYDETNGSLIVNNDFSNSFNYKENINAGYVNYSFEKSRFSLQVGLRFENTIISGHQFGNAVKADSSFDRTLNNLFPTFYLNYKLDSADRNQFGFSYGRRIDRPNYQDMNPFTYPLDRFTLYGGNPFLRPTISNNFELTHTFKNILTTGLQVNYTQDLISETIEQTNGIFFSRPGNFGKLFSYGITMNVNFSPVKWWTVQLYTQLLNGNYKATLYGQDVKNSGAYWYVNNTNQFQINKKWSAELSGFYQTKTYYAQFVLIPVGGISAGVSRKLFKDNGSIKLNIQDPFYINRGGGEIIGLSNSTADWRNKFDSRVLTVAFSYRFSKGENLKARNTGGSDSEKGRVN